MPRKPSCQCGDCAKCRARLAARERYQAMTVEERRAWVARRDPEAVRAADRARHRRDRPKRLAAMRDYAHENPEVLQAAKGRYVERNPAKRAAHHAVSNALRDGKLIRGACERHSDGDCQGRVEAHHDDYDRPLDVRWLCEAHHKAHHVEERGLS